MLTKAKIEALSPDVTLKLIQAEGLYKGLVLDMTKVDGRLLYISSGRTAQEATDDAMDYIEAMARSESGQVWQ